jgi:hypothetical protein
MFITLNHKKSKTVHTTAADCNGTVIGLRVWFAVQLQSCQLQSNLKLQFRCSMNAVYTTAIELQTKHFTQLHACAFSLQFYCDCNE